MFGIRDRDPTLTKLKYVISNSESLNLRRFNLTTVKVLNFCLDNAGPRDILLNKPRQEQQTKSQLIIMSSSTSKDSASNASGIPAFFGVQMARNFNHLMDASLEVAPIKALPTASILVGTGATSRFDMCARVAARVYLDPDPHRRNEALSGLFIEGGGTVGSLSQLKSGKFSTELHVGHKHILSDLDNVRAHLTMSFGAHQCQFGAGEWAPTIGCGMGMEFGV